MSNVVREPSADSKDVTPRRGLRVAVVFVVLLAVVFVRAQSGRIIDRIPRIDVDMQNLHSALYKYQADCGAFPKGDNKAVLKALCGDNPAKEEFFRCGPEFLSQNGELLDPWGTPYRFDFSAKGVTIRSAGPNKRFDVSGEKGFDDILR
jgi:hypothetical protein